jgi:lysyl oxidase
VVKLMAAQSSITVPSFRGQVYLDPGIYVASLGSALQFDVQRASYTKPITISQVIFLPGGGTQTRPLPSSVLDGFYGLAGFVQLRVTNAAGQAVAHSTLEFCPNSYDPQRAVPGSALTDPYPAGCGADPFPRSLVMGLPRGWGADPFGSFFGPGPRPYRLAPGTYTATETIAPRYVRLLGISAADATASVKVTVVKGKGCCGPLGCCGRPAAPRTRALGPLPRVPYLVKPPAAALPDLVPLPSWGISTATTKSGKDLLDFGATVWVGGNSPLDVEGFRTNGSPIMQAYQYFWQNGHVIGRVRAGTMGFDSNPTHSHWHFEQFARYALLDSAKNLVVRSHKVGFCIAPTDPVDLLAPHAVWQPPSIGFGGQCGTPTALWVQEEMPIGWADTYVQTLAGQAFNITSVPNGTYYIEIIANPQHVLYETNTRNDVSLRKVILGGTPGARTVKVPAWHGIDPEG